MPPRLLAVSVSKSIFSAHVFIPVFEHQDGSFENFNRVFFSGTTFVCASSGVVYVGFFAGA